MRVITKVLTRKVSSILLGMKIRYKLKKRTLTINNYTIKYRVVYKSNIGEEKIFTAFNCRADNFFMTAGEILKHLNLSGDLYLTHGKKLYMLKPSDFVFDKCLYCDNKDTVYEKEVLKRGVISKEIASAKTFLLAPDAHIFVFNFVKSNWFASCRDLRVLVIKHSFVQNVCLDDLEFLNYLDLSHNYLEDITISKTLQYCNLSHNNLQCVDVQSNSLDLSYNSISFFYSKFMYHNLNLKNNPLKVLSAFGNTINVSNTKIKNLFCRGIKKLISCNNKGINLYSTEHVRFLNLNNCGLKSLRINHNSLEVVKLRNNKLEGFPSLGRLKYLDLSGNKIGCIVKYPAVYVNAGRNPVRHVLTSNKFTKLNLAYVNGLNMGKLKNVIVLPSHKHSTKTRHSFRKIHKIVVSIPRFVFCKFYFVTAFIRDLNFKDFLETAMSLVDKKLDNFDYFLKVVNFYQTILRENQTDALFYAIMIEETRVCIKSVSFPLVFTSFVVHKVIETDDVYVFENIGVWKVFPLLGCTEFIRKRSNLLNQKVSIYNYMDIYCSYTKDLEVVNGLDLYESGIRDIRIVNNVVLDSKCGFDDIMNGDSEYFSHPADSIIPSYDINTCSIPYLAYVNADPQTLLPTPGYIHNKEDKQAHDTTTFVFLKIHSSKSKNLITASPYNYIIGTLCKLFQTVLFEQHDNQCSAFLGFDCTQGLVFAMYIYRILIHKGIRVSIGIACGDYSVRWSLMFPKLFGYGLNKSARFASMGEGVFCCKCVKAEHKDLVFKSHGKKYMKGFKERLEVFSVHFKNPYRLFLC